MGNRFAAGNGSRIAQYAGLAMQLYGLKQNADRNDLAEKEHAMRERFGKEDRAEEKRINKIKYGENGESGLEHRKLDVDERRLQYDESQLPHSQHNFSRSVIAPQIAKMKAGGDDKANKEIIDHLVELADNPDVTKGEAYTRIKANWPHYQKTTINNLQKELDKGVAANPDFMNTALGQDIIGEMQALESDPDGQMIDSLFPMVVAERNQEKKIMLMKQREAKAKLLKAQSPKLYETTEGYLPASKAEGKLKPVRGMVISTDKDGNTIIETNAPQGGALQKKTVTDIEKDIYNSAKRYGRVSAIQQTFDPKFQQYGTRLKKSLLALKDKTGSKLKPDEKKLVKEFSSFKQDSIENLNMYIKEITGAQMSEPEANRLKKGMPDPGTGIFDGDGPTEFKAKMENTIKKLRMTQARYAYWKRNGFDTSIESISTKSMPNIMKKWAKGMEESLISAGKSKQEAKQITMQELPKYFGIAVE